MTRWLWTAPDGSVTDLSAWGSGNYVTADGTHGQLAPAYNFQTQAYAGIDGEQLQQISALPGAPVLGLDLVASDPVELRTRLRSLAHVLRPRAGLGTLTTVADDGTQRTLPCYYRKGLEAGVYVASRFLAALEFWAPSPWWRGDPFTAAWSLAAPTPFFPIPPVTLSATTITGTVAVDMTAIDAPTFPVWTITGPGSALNLSNTYQGVQPDGSVAQVTASAALTPPAGSVLVGDGQTLTIDTRPGYQRITRSDGMNLFGWLGTDPALWPLVDGINTVSAALTGAGANSRVTITADRLYSGAL